MQRRPPTLSQMPRRKAQVCDLQLRDYARSCLFDVTLIAYLCMLRCSMPRAAGNCCLQAHLGLGRRPTEPPLLCVLEPVRKGLGQTCRAGDEALALPPHRPLLPATPACLPVVQAPVLPPCPFCSPVPAMHRHPQGPNSVVLGSSECRQLFLVVMLRRPPCPLVGAGPGEADCGVHAARPAEVGCSAP
jgi:hypothetical protein